MLREVLRSTLSRLLFGPLIALSQLVPTASAQSQDQHKRVLVLYSLRSDAQFSIIGESVLPHVLAEGLGNNLDYYSEFIDLARFPDPAYRSAQRDFLRRKYQGVRFNLVIALQDPAIEFVRAERDGLLSETPIVFL